MKTFRKNVKEMIATGLILAIVVLSAPSIQAQRSGGPEVFEKIEMLVTEGGSIREIRVSVRFSPDAMEIAAVEDGVILRRMKYSDIRTADYSYTKHPRWKTGLGVGATAIVFPPILFVAIPLAFTKHRRHWVTIRGENDYAVLKVSKSIRKIFMPAFETYTNVRIEALGENK